MPDRERISVEVDGGVGRDVVVAGRDVVIDRRTLSREERLNRRNRRILLDKVRDFWVVSVLEGSLYREALIRLSMTPDPGAVGNPWDSILRRPGSRDEPLPSDKGIVGVFDDLGGELLILGQPGSGKTTTLLELARDLIARAEEDEAHSIPVVFNLSSWAEKRKSIAEWLVDELNTKYQVPRKVGEAWVEADELLLLLDGLDEVEEEHRNACVEAINAFRGEHGLMRLIVCSRTAEYEALAARLNLQGAVVLQPLSHEQVIDYLARFGDELSAIRDTLQTDETLWELLDTPLMLSIVTLAYRGAPRESLPPPGAIEERRRHLFDAYVERMFEHRLIDVPYDREQTTHWLAWLARKMVEHAQSVFLIERMQPSWPDTAGQRWLYRIGVVLGVGLFSGLFFGLGFGLVGRLAGGLVFRLVGGLLSGLIFGLIGGLGLLFGLVFGLREIEPVETLSWSWRSALRGLGGGLGGVLVGGLSGLLISNLVGGVIGGLGGALIRWLGIGLGIGLAFGLEHRHPETDSAPNQGVKRSTGNAVLVGLVGMLVGGLLDLLIGGLIGSLVGGVVYGLVGVLVRWLGIGLGIGLFLGLENRQLETGSVPNQGIKRSTGNAVLVGLVGTLIGGLGAGVVGGLVGGLVVGLVAGLVAGLIFGGLAVIQHVVLRLILTLTGHMPPNYARFLGYAVERVFLRRVGGGYIFVHRLLMEHFAALEPET
jgi:DNA polymerase III delta prime subunit